MDGPRRYYPKKLNKSDKDKYYMISLICEIFKKKKKNEQAQKNRNRVFIQRTNRWLLGGGVEVEGKKQVRMMKRYKLQLGSK